MQGVMASAAVGLSTRDSKVDGSNPASDWTRIKHFSTHIFNNIRVNLLHGGQCQAFQDRVQKT